MGNGGEREAVDAKCALNFRSIAVEVISAKAHSAAAWVDDDGAVSLSKVWRWNIQKYDCYRLDENTNSKGHHTAARIIHGTSS